MQWINILSMVEQTASAPYGRDGAGYGRKAAHPQPVGSPVTDTSKTFALDKSLRQGAVLQAAPL